MENLRFIHTADWHLGHSFLDDSERIFEHQAFLDSLLNILKNENADCLIVSGDIFDNVNPSAAAQKLLFQFLNQAHQKLPFLETILLAGNHDSAQRLVAPESLLQSFNVRVVGNLSDNLNQHIVELKNKNGQTMALCLVLPYLRLSDVAPFVEEKENQSASAIYALGMKNLYQKLIDLARQQAPHLPLIATGHCYVRGGHLCQDSERYLSVGGQEGLDSVVFPQELLYVALGHLHKAQQVAPNVFYSGSSIALSFAERHYEHQVKSVLIENKKIKENKKVLIPKSVDFIQIPEKNALNKNEILNQIQLLPEKQKNDYPQTYPFLKIIYKMQSDDIHAHFEIKKALENKAVRLIKLESYWENQNQHSNEENQILQKDIPEPLDLFEKIYQKKFNEALPTQWRDAFLDLMAHLEEEETP